MQKVSLCRPWAFKHFFKLLLKNEEKSLYNYRLILNFDLYNLFLKKSKKFRWINLKAFLNKIVYLLKQKKISRRHSYIVTNSV